jgi:hypothetical protein
MSTEITSEEERNIELHVLQCQQALVKVAEEYVQKVYIPNMTEEFGFESNETERKGIEYILNYLVQDIGTDLLMDTKFEEYLGYFKEGDK